MEGYQIQMMKTKDSLVIRNKGEILITVYPILNLSSKCKHLISTYIFSWYSHKNKKKREKK